MVLTNSRDELNKVKGRATTSRDILYCLSTVSLSKRRDIWNALRFWQSVNILLSPSNPHLLFFRKTSFAALTSNAHIGGVARPNGERAVYFGGNDIVNGF
jgi:hypothetical protein